MQQTVVIALAVALVFFVWVWIGLTIVQRLSLEQKIASLENIENRLPEEENRLARLSDLRDIERNKIRGAKAVIAVVGLLLLASLALVTLDARVQEIFGFQNLQAFTYLAIAALAFMVLPTYVGLSLANPGRSRPRVRREASAK